MTPTNEAGHGLPELPEPYKKGRKEIPGAGKFDFDCGAGPDLYTADQMRQYALDALALSRGVPEGWKLVPVEPTEAMCGAIEYGAARPICETHQADRMYFLRKAIAAAPAAAGAQGEAQQMQALTEQRTDAGVPCKAHPDAPHGLDRTASHSIGRYVCECEGWSPAPQPAAADGGVRERAREILADAQQMADGHGVNARLILDEGMSLRCNVACDVALRAVSAALSSHRQAGEPDDVEKSVSVLRVLHQGSADDMAKAGREDLANVHYDAIRLLDYALDLHRQNVSMPNSGDSEYKPWAKAIDELAWVIGELEYIEGMKAIKSSEIPDYISRKAAWRESCEALVKEHGSALLTPPPGPDLSKFRELAERWRAGVGIDLETRLQCADDLIALVEKGAGNG